MRRRIHMSYEEGDTSNEEEDTHICHMRRRILTYVMRRRILTYVI
jgi:hypothetical protein